MVGFEPVSFVAAFALECNVIRRMGVPGGVDRGV
eukprot:CAMPEP_0119023002 /NCGR_PEP_ID=MMETSP1176-20130426/29184_1 /TAXON_ID=265551 /ORGANISM="Synedropsis recta cf, Strain CCMP1620" /LENGTH=33 /DNA_ID= /DNA_START= /DNA_END= /DNA_ORIENTATION=